MTLSYISNKGGSKEMEKEELDEIIENHVKWLCGNDGKRAYLRKANLCGAELSGVNLKKANLEDADLPEASLYEADLCKANLCGANLRDAYLCKANLYKANLRDADLRDADLRRVYLLEANLVGAKLEGAILPTGIYQIVRAGFYNHCITYDSINDQVVCGSWDDDAGNHLNSFAKRIEEIYGENGETPDLKYYTEYMSAVAFFKSMKELAVRQSQ